MLPKKIWIFIFLHILFILLNVLAQPSRAIELPDIGASSGTVVSTATERKIGEAVMRNLRRQLNVIEDLEINNYFETIGKKLTSYSDIPTQPFHFFVVDSDEVNAFAMPGGFIGVHSGLILDTHDESELASVLAHEIAHITQHHLARTFEAVNKLSLPMAIATIAAIVASATLNNPEIGQAAVSALAAGGQQMQVNFTRAHEKEADRIGVQLLASAGFDPMSMPNFFETLQKNTRYYQQKVPEFLRTHPVTTDRIAEAKERAKYYPKKMFAESIVYQLMRAKLLVLVTRDKIQLTKKLQDMLKNGRYSNELATRYALVLALLASEKTAGVQEHLDWLFTQDGDRVVYRLQQARLAWLQKQVPKVIQIYEQALQIYPNDQLLSLDYAEKLLQNNNPERAKAILLASSSSPHSRHYQLLAQAQQMLGNNAEAHLALAESAYLQGRIALALSQLKQARQQKALDFYVAARVEARYQELQAIWQEEQADSAIIEP